MSGPRPVHLSRRGAVYAVRFPIPLALQQRLGLREIRRSLFTKDIDVARRRCLDATLWFNKLMKRCEAMPEITKTELELAARDYFNGLANEISGHRAQGLDPLNIDSWIIENVEGASQSIQHLENALRLNSFEPFTVQFARGIIDVLNAHGFTNNEHTETLACQLIIRAHRQAVRFWMHRLQSPALPYIADDPAFDVGLHGHLTSPPRPDAQPLTVARSAINVHETDTADRHSGSLYPTLSQVVEMFVERLERKGTGESHRDEVGRALGWLQEELGSQTPVDQITTAEVRNFRNNIVRMDASSRGRKMPFRQRLTDISDRHIAHATASKYWSAVKGLFDWAAAEGRCPVDPAAKLKLDKPKGEEVHSPEAYSRDELIKFYRTPLYTGYQSPHRTRQEGDCHQRGQHWWAGVLPLFTGIRAGELTQLLPTDFYFEGPIPYFRVHELDADGNKTKSTKTKASTRDVPISPILLELGLRQFVERRGQTQRKARVFEQFRVGTRGKVSEGMTRYWGDYVRVFGLHKRGRGTHVWRHTVIARLRALGILEEDIAAFVGHGHGTITSRYGGSYPIERKKLVAEKLVYDFCPPSAPVPRQHQWHRFEVVI
jgi:integrase